MPIDAVSAKTGIPKAVWIPAAVIVVLGAVVLVSDRPSKTPEGLYTVETVDDFVSGIKKAEELSKSAFIKDANGEPVTTADKENLRQAAHQFDNLGRFRPSNVGTFLGAGKAYRIVGDSDVAKVRFRQVVDNERFDTSQAGRQTVAEAAYELSQLLIVSSELDEAKRMADKAVSIVPESAFYLTGRAAVLVEQRKYDEARKDLAAALKLDPNFKPAQRLMKLITAFKK